MFGRVETWRGRFAWVETSAFVDFGELRGAFGVYGNLKGLFGRVKTSVCGAVGNLEGAFRDWWKLRGGRLRVWKLGILAHEKLSVCNRGLRETS